MFSPPNITNNVRGYNSQMFKSSRAVRNGFRMLGYGINSCNNNIPYDIIRQFQKDFNKCSSRFDRWGSVSITGDLNKDTLNALEIAIRWSKKRENIEGTPSARSWQVLCADKTNCKHVEENGVNFVEVSAGGLGILRNIYNDKALRCNVISFERHGDEIFALIEIPPQGDLPNGKPGQLTCPCVFAK